MLTELPYLARAIHSGRTSAAGRAGHAAAKSAHHKGATSEYHNYEINNFTRAVARGDFASLEGALKAAETRRTTLLAELESLEQVRAPGVLQLTPAALEHHLQELVQELRSGIQGKVRDAIERTVGKITVDADGTMTIEARPDGLLGVEGRFAPLGCRGRESNPHGASPAGISEPRGNSIRTPKEVEPGAIWQRSP